LEETDPLVDERAVSELIGESDWKELLQSDPVESAFLRRLTRTGRPCGDERFVALAEKATGRRLHRLKPGPKPREKKR
jgi:hypothetical protein